MGVLRAKVDGVWVDVNPLGPQGPTGPAGPTGPQGPAGIGAEEVAVQAEDPGAPYELWYDTDEPEDTIGLMPPGGNTNQVLTKDSATSYDTSWKDASGGGSEVAVQSTDPGSTFDVWYDTDAPVPALRTTPIAAKVHRASNLGGSVPSATFQVLTYTFVEYGASMYDGAQFGLRIPAGEGGLWNVNMQTSFAGVTGVGGRITYHCPLVNGANTPTAPTGVLPAEGSTVVGLNQSCFLQSSWDLKLNAGDLLHGRVYHDYGVATMVWGLMSIRKLGETPA